jgi:hypothetical protein
MAAIKWEYVFQGMWTIQNDRCEGYHLQDLNSKNDNFTLTMIKYGARHYKNL